MHLTNGQGIRSWSWKPWLMYNQSLFYQISLAHTKTKEQIFKKTLSFRKHRWVMFRSYISCRAKAQFTYLLSERSFRGRLLTDHEGKLLDLQVRSYKQVTGLSYHNSDICPQVEPDITKDSSAGRGAKTLSGGEKSFSQVCLLLALWEAMGSPIRCLDELYVQWN